MTWSISAAGGAGDNAVRLLRIDKAAPELLVERVPGLGLALARDLARRLEFATIQLRHDGRTVGVCDCGGDLLAFGQWRAA